MNADWNALGQKKARSNVKRQEFAAFTAELQQRLQADDQVLALIALGSMAELQRADEWSDHDFWVVAAPGKDEILLTDLAWLPNAEQIVAPIRHGQRYYTVLYTTGHLVEFAIFTPTTITTGKVDTYRILFDRIDLEATLTAIAAQSELLPDTSNHLALFHHFLISLLTGVGRAARGEQLNSDTYVNYFAVGALLELHRRHTPSPQQRLGDTLDPWRRVEIIYPELAEQLHRTLHLPLPERAIELLVLADQQLRPRMANYPTQAVEVVRRKLSEDNG